MQKETVSLLVENLEKRQRALKVSEVADLFQVSPMTIYRAAKEGGLPSFKVGARWPGRSQTQNYPYRADNSLGRSGTMFQFCVCPWGR